MDDTDLILLMALIQDCRTPYTDLAGRLKMSVPSVHRRIASMQGTGVITKFTAKLSAGFLRAVPVYLSGISAIFPIRQAIKNLREDDRLDIVVTGSGNSIYVRALLPTVQDLDPYVAFFRKAAAVAGPAIYIEAKAAYGSNPPHGTSSEATELGPIDYRILQALHNNARKPIADICDELRLSPKTVRNRLRRLSKDGVVEFSLEYQLGEQAGVSAFLEIFLKPDADPSVLRGRLVSDLGPRILWSLTAGNRPGILAAQSWSLTLAAHEELMGRLNAYEPVEKVGAYFISHYEFFEGWRDKLLRAKARAAAKS